MYSDYEVVGENSVVSTQGGVLTGCFCSALLPV